MKKVKKVEDNRIYKVESEHYEPEDEAEGLKLLRIMRETQYRPVMLYEEEDYLSPEWFEKQQDNLEELLTLFESLRDQNPNVFDLPPGRTLTPQESRDLEKNYKLKTAYIDYAQLCKDIRGLKNALTLLGIAVTKDRFKMAVYYSEKVGEFRERLTIRLKSERLQERLKSFDALTNARKEGGETTKKKKSLRTAIQTILREELEKKDLRLDDLHKIPREVRWVAEKPPHNYKYETVLRAAKDLFPSEKPPKQK